MFFHILCIAYFLENKNIAEFLNTKNNRHINIT